MNSRLATVDPDLLNRLQSLSDEALQKVAALAAREAVARTGLTDPRVITALGLDGSEQNAALRWSVEAVAARLDEQAWDIQDREGDSAQYFAVFEQARAASAVFFALDPDSRSAAADALYEAQAALGSVEALRSRLAL